MTEFGSITAPSIVGQDRPIRLLETFLRKGTIPHALLFSGIEGVGKKSVALAFAMACNCLSLAPAKDSSAASSPNEPELNATVSALNTPGVTLKAPGVCGRCKACKKIQANIHPDVLVVKPTGTVLRIAQIRDVIGQLALKPYEARYRVVIVSDAQAMNPESANAFLKILEEPPDRTILILTTHQSSDLLPTILSRCQHIRFNPVDVDLLADRLVQSNGIDPDQARMVAAMSGGSFTQALRLIGAKNSRGRILVRNWLVSEMERLGSQPIGFSLALAEKLARDKDNITEALRILKTWLRDLIVFRFHPAGVIYTDLIDRIAAKSNGTGISQTLRQIDAITLAQHKIRSNANLRLTLEAMLMEMVRAAAT